MPGASDWRALSLLETEQPTLPEILGGIGFTLAAFVLTPAMALLSAYVLGGMGTIFGSAVEELPPPPIEVIETRFVRLGKKKPATRLPSKEIPSAQQTAPVPQAPDSAHDVPHAVSLLRMGEVRHRCRRPVRRRTGVRGISVHELLQSQIVEKRRRRLRERPAAVDPAHVER